MSNLPPHEGSPGGNGNHEAVEQLQRIAVVFDAYSSHYKTAERNNSQHNRGVYRWSQLTAIGALVAAFFAALTFVAAVRSIEETRRATHYAREAAIAANKQVAVTEETAKRQLRAYIFAEPPVISGIVANQVPEITMDIHNSGQTPAYKLRLTIGSTIAGYPLRPGAVNFDDRIPNDAPETTLNPGMSEAGVSRDPMDRPITTQEIDAIADGKAMRIILAGRIVYLDAFGQIHNSNYCFTAYGAGQSTGHWSYCPYHNDAD